MFKNYLKIALRKLGKSKSHSALNILGLAIGMAGFVLIVLFIQDELAFDAFHEKGDRIYRIAGEYDQGGDTRNRSAVTTYLMKRWLDTSFPDVKRVVRLDFGSALIKYEDKAFQEDRLIFADPDFFDLFSFDLIRGESASVIAEPNTMVITEAMARKYFGERDPVGKMLSVDGTLVNVTGVMKAITANSHFHGDFIVSIKTVEPQYPKWVLTNATGTSHYTYVELAEGVAPAEIERQLSDYTFSKGKDFGESRTYFLQPLPEIHLRSHLSGEIEPNGDILYVYILAAVAVVILLMACINYTNLAVARSATRSKEVGIRKVVGANRKQLALQFLGESVIVAVCALLFAVLIVEMSLPFFNQVTGKAIQIDILQNLPFLSGLILLALFVGVLAGSYPALILSAMKSITTLKSIFTPAAGKSIHLRKALVVVQFIASAVLLVSTLVIYNQLTYMQNKKLGINPELVVTAPFQTGEMAARYEQLRNEFLRDPNVLSVASTNNPLTSRVGHWREYDVETLEESVMIPTMVVTHDFFTTLQAEFVAGRDFSRNFRTDLTDAYIINESAAKFLGLESPVGTAVEGRIFNGSEWSTKHAKIIGMVKDFHLASLRTEIQPTVFSLATPQTTPLRFMAIRISNRNISRTLSKLEETWQKFAPGRPMQYSFMDADIQQLYQSEQRFLQIFLAFSVLAIAITCLGLFGLSAYAAAQRTKEIGIRKVLGASVPNILGLFTREFIKLVVLANLIAVPIAWYVMQQWLLNFAYRVNMQVGVFLLAGMLALLITVLTVSTQAIRVALTNPANSLRYE